MGDQELFTESKIFDPLPSYDAPKLAPIRTFSGKCMENRKKKIKKSLPKVVYYHKNLLQSNFGVQSGPFIYDVRSYMTRRRFSKNIFLTNINSINLFPRNAKGYSFGTQRVKGPFAVRHHDIGSKPLQKSFCFTAIQKYR